MNSEPPIHQRKHTFWAAGILLGITLALFGDLVFLPGEEVVSYIKGDTALNHVFLRDLGFTEIRKGNLPLWNPYLFSGTPFLGSMQAALLYPLNITYLFLPIQKAINLDVALHLFLLGFFTFLWLRNWNLNWIGALYAGIVIMLCGSTYLRILAGQINVIASFAWFPLLLLAIDGVMSQASWKRFPSPWLLLGVASTTMMVFAGYPQALFICAITAAIYTLARYQQVKHFKPVAAELCIIGGLPIFLGGIQLWTVFSLGSEVVRGSDMSYEFASSFSMAPEKLITLVAPAFFGDMVRVKAWGRWEFWDDSVYIGVVSFFFVVYGFRSSHVVLKRLAILILSVTLIISLGRYTPVHQWLFDYVPGFDKFRCPSKFLFVTSFFMAVLAGLGVDRLIRENRNRSMIAYSSLFFGGILLLVVGGFQFLDLTSEDKLWWNLISKMKSTPDTYIWVDVTAELVEQSAVLARNNFFIASSALLLFGLMLLGATRYPFWKYAAVSIGVAELVFFAFSYKQTFEINNLGMPALDEAMATDLDDERILCVPRWIRDDSNYAVGHRAFSVWGYDPVLLKRYAQFMATMSTGFENQDRVEKAVFNWGTEPASVGMNLGLLKFTTEGTSHNDKVYQMLRCRYIVKLPMSHQFDNYLNFIRGWGLVWDDEEAYIPDSDSAIHRVDNLMPRFSMMGSYKVIQDRDEILQTLDSSAFNPAEVILLEEKPVPTPGTGSGQVGIQIVNESTDHVTLRVETSIAGILLITDAYSEGWKATALPGSVQQEYDVMPADLALRAIPLEAGSHLFRLEYLPDAFIYGRIATFAGMGVFVLLAVASYVRRNNSPPESV